MSTRFFTNEEQNTLLEKFKGIFTHNPDIERFDALVGYLRASGYFAIRPHLEKVPNVRILVGIDVDEIVESYSRKGRLFLANAGEAISEFRKQLDEDIREAAYTAEVEAGVRQFVEDVASKKIEVRAHPTKRLHAKIYIFIPKGFNEHKPGAVITGSSNLTAAGLGVEERSLNYEFNVLLHNYEDVQFAWDEFEKLWEEGVHILPKTVNEIAEKTFLRDDITPFELYIKLLIEYFGASIEYDPNSETDLPEGFMRLAYQMDAVRQGFMLMQKHNGFFLSDVVGLGKTIIAVLIAKKFFYHNDFPGHLSEILIIVPPALKQSWEDTLHKFDLKYTKVISNGSLHKLRHPEKYDLVIVDEAHKFRNDTADAYDVLQRICKTPTRRKLPDGTFMRKKVLLVSATPLNNRPMDIRNLILLFQDSKDSTLEIANLQRFFARQQKAFDHAMKNNSPEVARERIKTIYEEIRTKVVGEITIRRTRSDLDAHEEYKADLANQGIRFPLVGAPEKILYELSPALDSLYDQTLKVLDSELTYNRYRAIGHLVPEKKLKYQNADRVSSQLARIMRTMLLKRLDSSFHAFTRSICRFRDATEAMVTMFENGRVYIAPQLNVSEYILEGREEELAALIESLQADDPTIEVCTPDDFDKSFLIGLEKDHGLLQAICLAWEAVKEDPKIEEFIRRLRTEFCDVRINHHAATKESPRLVVFSESKETSGYIAARLRREGYDRLLLIDSATRREKMPLVRANFDANWPLEDQADDFDIIISTEVLAEGVNLHRANVIVNYDTPWNSTRLMQRIGRVNRIGTTAPRVHVFNFFPTAQVDANIDIKKKAIIKLQAFHSALGEDSQIYSTDEEVDTFGLFDKEVEEDRDEALAYLMELRKLRKENAERFRQIKALPIRSRTGRKDRHRSGETLTFVRNQRRDAFFYINQAGEVEELSFVEAARIFHATDKEKRLPLHDRHHEQVNAAIESFQDAIKADAVRDRVVDHLMNPTEKRALKLLKVLIDLPNLATPEEIAYLRAAQTDLRRGTHTKLPSRLGKLEQAQRKTPVKPVVLLDRVIEVLKEYRLNNSEETPLADSRDVLSLDELAPKIILSESFTIL